MKKKFENWMTNTENKVSGTVVSYAAAINRISRHYSDETSRHIDVYKIKDIQLLKKICKDYNKNGRFRDFGNEYNGLYRAAISAYVRFFEKTEFSENNNFYKEINLSVSDSKITVKKYSTGEITVNISLQIEGIKELKI